MEVFNFYPPKSSFNALLSIPHPGVHLPEEFLPYLSPNHYDLLQDVDFATDQLVDIDALQNQGVAVLVANIARTCIDLNRPREKALLHWKKNTMEKQLVLKEPSEQMSERLLGKYYDPYYAILKSSIEELQKKRKPAPVIDLHSMPSFATDFHMRYNTNQERERPDFCLSDLEGQSCPKNFIQKLQKELEKNYSKVSINNPYWGGYLTHYINEFEDIHNLQIEIKRNLYMDENSRALTPESLLLKEHLTRALLVIFAK